MKQLLKHKTNWLARMLFILVGLFIFQSSIVSVSADPIILGQEYHSSISESCTHDENVNLVRIESGRRNIANWVISKSQVGSECENVQLNVRIAAKGATNLIPKGKLANHLFKGAGKLADNPANRTLIQKISNGKALGVDAYGKSWYTGVNSAGKPIYSYTRNGVVNGAGYMNMTPAEMIIKYGIK